MSNDFVSSLHVCPRVLLLPRCRAGRRDAQHGAVACRLHQATPLNTARCTGENHGSEREVCMFNPAVWCTQLSLTSTLWQHDWTLRCIVLGLGISDHFLVTDFRHLDWISKIFCQSWQIRKQSDLVL